MSDKPTEGQSAPGEEIKAPGTVLKRPLVPLVLAFMLGLLAAAWGLNISGYWLVALLAGLLVVMFLGYFFNGFGKSQGERHEQP
jgi:hypothetical protein